MDKDCDVYRFAVGSPEHAEFITDKAWSGKYIDTKRERNPDFGVKWDESMEYARPPHNPDCEFIVQYERKNPRCNELSERLIFPTTKTMSLEIDDYRFVNRIDSKSEAIRRLISLGLKVEAEKVA